MALLTRYYAAMNAAACEDVLECYADGARLDEVASGHSREGEEALRKGLDGFFALFRGARFETGSRIVAGDSVLCPYTLTAEMARDLGPLRLAGRRIRLEGAHLAVFRGDRIALMRDFYDFAALAAQAAPAEPTPTA